MPFRSAAIAIGLVLWGALSSSAPIRALEPESLPLSPAVGSRTAVPALDFYDRAVVLCWHTFLGKESIPTDFSVPEFAAQIDTLRSLGYRFATMEDLVFGRIRGPLNLVVTIDDGNHSVPEAYEKVLAPRGIEPAIFIYPAVIGTMFFAMKDSAVRELRDAGCVIGAHGYHHLFINQNLYDHDRFFFNEEVFKSQEKVGEITGLPAYLFAYPYGVYSDITIRELMVAGYRNAFAVRTGFVYADSRLNSPYELPRIVVRRDQWKELLDFLERNAAAATEEIASGVARGVANGAAHGSAAGEGVSAQTEPHGLSVEGPAQ
ncbi:MAG: polysaccharide deacetylase family protein [Treponema sp.]|nr:polysaccharide deacetylase family protein [Treponema sp.]